MGFRGQVVGTGNMWVGFKGLGRWFLKDQSPRAGSGWGLRGRFGGLAGSSHLC